MTNARPYLNGAVVSGSLTSYRTPLVMIALGDTEAGGTHSSALLYPPRWKQRATMSGIVWRSVEADLGAGAAGSAPVLLLGSSRVFSEVTRDTGSCWVELTARNELKTSLLAALKTPDIVGEQKAPALFYPQAHPLDQSLG